MITIADAGVLLGAGLIAGAEGTAGGISSLVSYPALLAVGVPVLPANLTNIVALVGAWPSSALASKPELSGRADWLRRTLPVALAGGATGAVVLLLTPTSAFRDVVPFLIAFASFALLLQPRIAAWRKRTGRETSDRLLLFGMFGVSIYNGYFGAGAGVMLLALLLLTAEPNLTSANALKNMVLGAATAISALLLIVFGSVDWAAAGPLALGIAIGSALGPSLARRVPAAPLRWLVALTGLGLAARLWFAPL